MKICIDEKLYHTPAYMILTSKYGHFPWSDLILGLQLYKTMVVTKGLNGVPKKLFSFTPNLQHLIDCGIFKEKTCHVTGESIVVLVDENLTFIGRE